MVSAKLTHMESKQITILMIFVPLVLAAYTHFFNPLGFPSIHLDESHYLRRAMHVMEGYGPQEVNSIYDHPYFGQIFVGSVLKIANYPGLVNPNADNFQSIEMLYLVPRLLMGISAVVSTFLVFKIAEYRYNRSIALIASILFAVLPYTLATRRVLLEPILLPFLLAAILFAVILGKYGGEIKAQSAIHKKKILLTVLSGIFLGLAIFTKIPIVTMIPLVGYLVLKGNNRSVKMFALWLIPVILIPAIWPLHALSLGEFDDWMDGILFQTDRTDRPLSEHFQYLLSVDALMLIIGVAGLVFALVKRDAFPLLWSIPFLVFLYLINYVSSFFFIPVFPAMCIAAAAMIYGVCRNGRLLGRLKEKRRAVYQNIALTAVITTIGVYALAIDTLSLNTDENETYLKTVQFVTKVLDDHDVSYGDESEVTVYSSALYHWIPKYIFGHEGDDYASHYNTAKLQRIVDNPGQFLLVMDRELQNILGQENRRGELLENLYDQSMTAAEIDQRIQTADNKTESLVTTVETSWQPTNTYFANVSTVMQPTNLGVYR